MPTHALTAENPSSLSQRSTPVELEATTGANDPPIDQTSVSTPSSHDDQEPANPKWNVQAAVFKPSSSPTCDTHAEPHHSDVSEYRIFPHTLEGSNNIDTTIYENRAEKQLRAIYGHSAAYNPDQPSYRGDTLEASRQGMIWTGVCTNDVGGDERITKNSSHHASPSGYNNSPDDNQLFSSHASSFQALAGLAGPRGVGLSYAPVRHRQSFRQKHQSNLHPETLHKEQEEVSSFPGKVDDSFPSLSGPTTKTNTSPSPLPVFSSGGNTKSWANIAASPGRSTKAPSKFEEEEKTDHHKVPSATSVPRYTGESWAKVAAGTQERK
ncbi:uncharacterized protein L199_007195 [Kwoniella botswanensis]|uniref:uncharacterized protein n=1 Tax=Kwoniella botswanensis TaxID=1268659 RepID=UPI00315D84E9